MLYFGQGLVKTLDDFGAQGTWPTHPELLDWLAVEFRDNGWDVKHMIKLMVMSNTYRQASTASDALEQRDPYNQLYARQAPLPARSRADPRQRPGGERACCRPRSAAPAPSPINRPGTGRSSTSPRANGQKRQRRQPVSPRPVHLLAANLPASEPAGLRCLQPRRVQRRTPALQHAAAGPGAAQRPDLCRGGPGLRSAHPAAAAA